MCENAEDGTVWQEKTPQSVLFLGVACSSLSPGGVVPNTEDNTAVASDGGRFSGVDVVRSHNKLIEADT